ncbi:MAG TPA: hypothetical protein DDX39_10425 [Bacteroidales bacterium]|nr:MAG: hypothetical protein A2W98_15500 [Bacteroidetes bacterium GWF2_33_38]OFY92278.1 MAG: hypothetical protein A2236_01060 [Bacteroidetes bacterium RIFOXYA2_FULL_33_7]HBF89045.1 hypothetical protein [Bacteroidales bacterium]
MKKSVIFVIAVFLLVGNGCQKYEEGPWLSLRSKENRVVGTWVVDKYHINGVDSTELYNQNKVIEFFQFEELKDEIGDINIYDKDKNEFPIKGRWDFVLYKDVLFFSVFLNDDLIQTSNFLFTYNKHDYYGKIIKLKETEMILEFENEYPYDIITRICFKKVEL